MIRRLEIADVNRVIDIWLETNLKTHIFISPEYWKSNLETVRELLPQSEVYVYDNNGRILGFVGLRDEYIEGLFVCGEMQSRGIGKCLLDYIKRDKSELHLDVYQKNMRAIRFYQGEGFVIQREGMDATTGEKDYEMIWEQKHDER